MSFAGPRDPSMERALQAAHDKGIVLVAAAGNAGPKSPPLYPGADPNVIAVTATDVNDKLFSGANRGRYIAVAAPGVDILVPAPDGTYQLTTGTSVASAEVSGIAALLLERNPNLTPDEIRKILTASARHPGSQGARRRFRLRPGRSVEGDPGRQRPQAGRAPRDRRFRPIRRLSRRGEWRMREWRVPTRYSLLATRYSLLATRYSLLATATRQLGYLAVDIPLLSQSAMTAAIA